MDYVPFIVAFLFVGMTAAFLLCCALVAMVAKEVCDGYRDLLKHARRHPRFGIGAVFSLVTISAAACGIFRWISQSSVPGETWFLVVVALMVAMGMVCAAQFVATDFRESRSRRRAYRTRGDLVWEAAESAKLERHPELPGGSSTT